MQNLYDTIISLVAERDELKIKGGALKYDAMHGDSVARATYDKMCDRFHVVNDCIDRINKKYVIDIDGMGKIISKNLGQTYVPKIFRETYEKNGEHYYTERFVACYIKEDNPYYKSKGYEISLSEDKFQDLLNSLEPTNSIMFSNSAELDYRPLFPKLAFQATNFVGMYTGFYCNTNELCRKFSQKVEPMLRSELESVKISNVDDDLSHEL